LYQTLPEPSTLLARLLIGVATVATPTPISTAEGTVQNRHFAKLKA